MLFVCIRYSFKLVQNEFKLLICFIWYLCFLPVSPLSALRILLSFISPMCCVSNRLTTVINVGMTQMIKLAYLLDFRCNILVPLMFMVVFNCLPFLRQFSYYQKYIAKDSRGTFANTMTGGTSPLSSAAATIANTQNIFLPSVEIYLYLIFNMINYYWNGTKFAKFLIYFISHFQVIYHYFSVQAGFSSLLSTNTDDANSSGNVINLEEINIIKSLTNMDSLDEISKTQTILLTISMYCLFVSAMMVIFFKSYRAMRR